MTDSTAETRRGREAPQQCLSFTVSGPWGHFRRIDGNVVKQTYRVIPRTTVAGLVAAMLGIERDGYYDIFASDRSAIAIEPRAELRTVNVPVNTLSTASEDIRNVPKRGRTLKIGLPDPTKPRQQHNYEVLVEPSYRIDLWLADDDVYERLADQLSEGKSHYVPSLGLSEYLATVDYHGEFDVEAPPTDAVVEVDSAVPNAVNAVIPEEGETHGVERSPAFMEQHEGGRRTTGFTSYAYDYAGGSLKVRDVSAVDVDGRTVMFV